MARIGRFVVPGLPHHVTQRGNRRERVFFSDADYELYRDLLHEACSRESVAVWSYCLLPNHVHLILTPATPEGLGRALGRGHRRYSTFVNASNRVTGHLFQGRFSSVVMDEEHLMAAALRGDESGQGGARRARRGLAVVERAGHLAGRDDGLVEVAPLLSRCGGRFADLIEAEPAPALTASLAPRRRSAALWEPRRFWTGSPRWPGAIRGRKSGAASLGPRGPLRARLDAPGEKASINRQLCMCHRYPRYPRLDIPQYPLIISLCHCERSEAIQRTSQGIAFSSDCRNGCEKVTA